MVLFDGRRSCPHTLHRQFRLIKVSKGANPERRGILTVVAEGKALVSRDTIDFEEYLGLRSSGDSTRSGGPSTGGSSSTGSGLSAGRGPGPSASRGPRPSNSSSSTTSGGSTCSSANFVMMSLRNRGDTRCDCTCNNDKSRDTSHFDEFMGAKSEISME